MKKLHLLLLPITYVVSLLLVSTNTLAAENESPAAEMDNLIAQGQYQQAYDLGAESLDEWEGEPEFDYAFGLAALESGNANEAVFALERVTASATDPGLRSRARLELARAYFVTNNLAASENLFNAVLATNPPVNVQQNIEVFLQLIESRRNSQRPSFNWTLSSVIGSDSNVNSATSNGLIDTPLIGQIELDPAGQESEDNFSSTSVQMTYSYPFTRDRSVNFNLNMGHLNNFETDQFDIDNVRGELAYNWGNEVHRFKHGISSGKVNLDQNGFQKTMAVNTSWQRAGENGWYQTLSGAYTKIRYDTNNGGDLNDLRDVDQLLLTAGVTKIAGPLTHTMSLYTADENPQASTGGDHNGRAFTGLAYSLLYRMNSQHTPYLRASYQDVEHDREHPVFFDTTRSGKNKAITVGWFWQVARNLMVTGEAAFTDNNSNIPLFDFTRFKYQAGVRYQF
ncbi:MAG: tetratricopeptide repeat protein [Pseudohongiellaceae bacterium]